MRDLLFYYFIVFCVSTICFFFGAHTGSRVVNKELLERKIKMHDPQTGELIFTKDYRK